MPAVMVTGGLGFVGRYLVRQLVQAGEQVVSYNRDYAESDDEAVRTVQGELFDIPRLARALEEHDVDRVLHTAAMSHPELSIDLPVTTFAANVQGTLSLFEAARMTGVSRIVNFSSECAYGHQEVDLVTEDAPLHPTTPYGVTKASTEMLGDVYGRLYGVQVVSLRITEVYGPGNPMPEVLREMIAAGVQGRPFQILAGGEHPFQFVHVEDVADAARAALAAQNPRPVYNITGGRQVTLGQAAELVRGIVPGADLTIGPGYIETLDRQGAYDIGAAANDLGYEPRWSLEDGIASYAEWLDSNRY